MGKLLVLGAGGHGRVVADAAATMGIWDTIDFLDDRSKAPCVIGVCADFEKYAGQYDAAFPAIGNNALRMQWFVHLHNAGYDIPVIIHSRACVSKSSQVAEGTVILANATINTNTQIEKGCIISQGVLIDHDDVIGLGCHIDIGAIVQAGCYIPPLTKVNAGVIITRRTHAINNG